jgi:N6-adenosine-specific RNA methylase IME4
MDRSGYRTIVADPPWPYRRDWDGASDTPAARRKFPKGQWAASFPMPYEQLSVRQIAALPVARMAAEDCDLYLWTTQRFLPAAFGVLEAWGFRYCQTLVWCKTPRGTGQGGLFTPTTEFALLGRRGRMPHKRRVPSTWFQWKRTRAHSVKPEAFLDLIEQVSEGPRLELFARRQRLGWDVWGDEVPCSIRLPA